MAVMFDTQCGESRGVQEGDSEKKTESERERKQKKKHEDKTNRQTYTERKKREGVCVERK